MRRLCVGDIHGCYDKLNEVLEKCGFSDSDVLYSVGDFTDRGKQNVQTLNFLMSLQNFKPVAGNHDLWNYEYLQRKITGEGMSYEAFNCWEGYNGGFMTLQEEEKQSLEWKTKVYNWLKNIPYRIKLDDYIIQHNACFKNAYEEIDVNSLTIGTLKSSGLIVDDVYDDYIWGRTAILGCHGLQRLGKPEEQADSYYRTMFLEELKEDPVYLTGHTPLVRPLFDRELGIINIDTGAFCCKSLYGIDGCLTILDMDSLDNDLEYWQSGKEGSFSL